HHCTGITQLRNGTRANERGSFDHGKSSVGKHVDELYLLFSGNLHLFILETIAWAYLYDTHRPWQRHHASDLLILVLCRLLSRPMIYLTLFFRSLRCRQEERLLLGLF